MLVCRGAKGGIFRDPDRERWSCYVTLITLQVFVPFYHFVVKERDVGHG